MTPARAEQVLRRLCVVRGLFWTHFASAVLVPFLRDWGGLGFAEILLLNAWFMVWNVALEVPTGAVADVFGRARSLQLGCVVAAGAALLYTSVPALPVFLVAEALLAAAYCLVSGADDALAYDVLAAAGESDRAARAAARLEAWKLGGIVVGALAGGPIAVGLGVAWPLRLHVVPALVAGAVALGVTEAVPPRGEVRAGWLVTLRRGVGRVLGDPVLRPLVLDFVLVGALAWLVIWFYQPLLEGAGVPLAWFGTVHAGMCLAQVGLLRVAHRATRPARLPAPLAAAFGVACLGLAATTDPRAVVPLVLVAAACGLGRGPVLIGEINRHAASGERATMLSTVSALRALAVAAVNPLAGWLADRSLPATVAVAGALALGLAALGPLRSGLTQVGGARTRRP